MSERQPANSAAAGDVDELDDYLSDQLQDPIFAAAYADAGYRENLLRDLVGQRKRRGLSQTVVAAAMGIKQGTLSEFEGGVGDPRVSTLQRYARALGGRLQLAFCEEWPQDASVFHLGNGAAVAPTASFRAAAHYAVDKVEAGLGAWTVHVTKSVDFGDCRGVSSGTRS